MDLLPITDAETGTLDAAWLAEKLGRGVTAAKIRDMKTMGGMAGSFHLLDVVLAEEPEEGAGNDLTLVVKTIPENRLGMSKTMNLWREADFYNRLAGELPEGIVPKVWFAQGDRTTGHKVLLMENLDQHVPAGVFFGPGNPNNWALAGELDSLVAAAGGQTGPEVAGAIFKLHAQLHAQFWQKAELLEADWLQGASWLQGNDQEKWQEQQAMIKGHYDKMIALVEAGESPVEYDEHTLACLKNAFDSVSWEAFQAELQTRPWTVCQGDCHAGNALWPGKPDMARGVTLIDFEAVALGSGAQDLGQFTISHMSPEVRRSCERQLVEDYHKELVAALAARGLDEAAATYTLEQAWAEYVAGGIGRWTFFVPLLTAMCPPKMNEFFRDQLAAFLKDHATDPTTVGMPRV